MINIRYHIVSITAVFLALGIGVALGSTFLDRATVDVLDRNIKSAENRIKATNAENDRLASQVADAKDRDANLISAGTEELLADRLTDVPVLVVTAPGVDKGDADDLRTVLERSGADLRGTLQLQAKLLFEGDPDAALADDLGLTDPTTDELRSAVEAQLTSALIGAGVPTARQAEDAGVTTTTVASDGGEGSGAEVPDGEQPSIVTILLDRDYLRLDRGPGIAEGDPILEEPGYRYVFLGAPGLSAAQNDVMISLLPAEDDALTMPALVVSATEPTLPDGAVAVPSVVQRVRRTDALAQRYSTVDNIDTFAGLLAVVLSTEHTLEIPVGHYGQADGASSVLPPAP